jgi:hypothetical protein
VTVGLVAVVLLLIVVISLLGRSQSARGAAQTAADLGALAAAQHLVGAPAGSGAAGGSGLLVGRGDPAVGRGDPAPGRGSGVAEACGIAREVVAANGAALSRCAVLDGGVVRVTANRPGGLGIASATARAGPGPTAPTPWWPVVVPDPTDPG